MVMSSGKRTIQGVQHPAQPTHQQPPGPQPRMLFCWVNNSGKPWARREYWSTTQPESGPWWLTWCGAGTTRNTHRNATADSGCDSPTPPKSTPALSRQSTRVKLLDHPEFLRQLRGLERRRGWGGKERLMRRPRPGRRHPHRRADT